MDPELGAEVVLEVEPALEQVGVVSEEEQVEEDFLGQVKGQVGLDWLEVELGVDLLEEILLAL